MNLVIQSYAQLAGAYPNGRDRTIRDNCNTTIFLSTNDIETAREISDRLGQISVTTRGQSFDRGPQGRMTESTSETTRPLLTPDEILTTIEPGTNIVLQTQQHPARLTMHRLEDYTAFPFIETPDPMPPIAPQPKLWPDPMMPNPEEAVNPEAVATEAPAVPEDAVAVGKTWEEIIGGAL